jgi:hypothetical protein
MSVNQVKIDAKQHAVTAVTVYQTNRAAIQRRLPVELTVCYIRSTPRCMPGVTRSIL